MNGFYWIYLVMLFFLLCYNCLKNKESKRLIYYSAVFFLILIFVAQDYSVSIDIAEYMRQYEIIPQLSFGEMLVHKFEIGYVLLCWLLQLLFESDRVLLLVLSLLILVPFGISFEKETDNPLIALMAFVALGMYLHAIIFWRQFVAMAILTFSYRFIYQRRLLPFLLTLLAAMTFHKVSIVFIWLYIIYNIPVNKWLILAGAGISVILGLLGKPIIEFGISVIYPRYTNFPRLSLGGGTLLALFWVVTILAYFTLKDRMNEGKVRLPFLMLLTAATIQPVCFAFYNWLRVVLFFRIALVPMTALLYEAMFQKTQDNQILNILQRLNPRWHAKAIDIYSARWFPIVIQLLMFAVLFVWYVSELEGARYIMAPVVTP